MKLITFVTLGIAGMLCGLAYAEEAQITAPQPTQLCVHSGATIQMSGLDLDGLRCQLAVLNQDAGEQHVEILAMQATIKMLTADLAAANARAAELEKKPELPPK